MLTGVGAGILLLGLLGGWWLASRAIRPIEDISALAVREKWDVKELHAEAGRLDEVFRAITTHDAARTKASAA